jgi:putative toxin-antitoxin system antitoxin component (TIGR02293 family)
LHLFGLAKVSPCQAKLQHTTVQSDFGAKFLRVKNHHQLHVARQLSAKICHMSDTVASFHFTPPSETPSRWVVALGLEELSSFALIDEVTKGLPASAFDRFSQASGLTREILAHTLRVSTRTVARYKNRGERLDPAISERLVRLAVLYLKAEETIGDPELAKQWMQTPRLVFDGKTPLEMAETEVGAREVEDLLLRIEHGVFS